jgi:hypothetical protein
LPPKAPRRDAGIDPGVTTQGALTIYQIVATKAPE